MGIEEANNPLGLLKRLNQPIQQDPIKAPVMPTNAALVVFEEAVHDRPQLPPNGSQDITFY